jgi:Fe2+ or Zn2+ uptake regulation protein
MAAMAPTSLAEALHARGLRLTPQREQVLAAVHRMGHARSDRRRTAGG